MATVGAAAFAPITLGPFVERQPFSEATIAAARAGLSLKPYEQRGPFYSYVIMKGDSDVRGALGVCNGRVQFASFTVDDFDDFTSILRERIREWGQPRVNVVTLQVVDASRSVEMMDFKWLSRRYTLRFSARRSGGLTGDQSFGDGLKCL